MDRSGKQKLHSLLFEGETKLVNLKLFPGTGRELTADSLAEAASDALQAADEAWKSGIDSQPPDTGLEKRRLEA